MSSKRKRTILANMALYKCPRCQEGDLFTKPFQINKPLSMPKNCEVCGQSFEPEPGFYFGAMFISYIITSFFFLGVVAVCMIYLGWSLNASFVLVLFLGAALFFFVLRFSRSIWINIMISYDSKASENYKKRNF